MAGGKRAARAAIAVTKLLELRAAALETQLTLHRLAAAADAARAPFSWLAWLHAVSSGAAVAAAGHRARAVGEVGLRDAALAEVARGALRCVAALDDAAARRFAARLVALRPDAVPATELCRALQAACSDAAERPPSAAQAAAPAAAASPSDGAAAPPGEAPAAEGATPGAAPRKSHRQTQGAFLAARAAASARAPRPLRRLQRS